MTRRYSPLVKIASGGTATVYVGTASGDLGFRQLVAIKQPHAHLAEDPAFVQALVDEAKIASRLRHANVVDVRDVEADASGVQLVMDYVEGASLSDLVRSWLEERPARAEAIAIRVVLDACEGLRAVHDLVGDGGEALGLVHRDISPANVLVGLDGVARIADFGLAKPLLAVERTTSEGALRGKLGYMAPEYVRGREIDRRVDVFAMGIVAWEVIARKRLFRGTTDAETLDRLQREDAPSLVEIAPSLAEPAAKALDAVIARALAKEPDARFATIEAFADALAAVAKEHDLVATHAEVRESFGAALRARLEERRRAVREAESAGVSSASSVPAIVTTAGVVPSAAPPPVSPSAAAPPPVSPSAAPPPVSPSAPPPPTSPPALASTPAAPHPSARRLLPLLLVIPVLLVTGVGILLAAAPSTLEKSAGIARSAASDLSPRDPDVRGRASEEPAPASASGSASSTRPRPVTRPRPDEPGFKGPRPNPYASGGRPR